MNFKKILFSISLIFFISGCGSDAYMNGETDNEIIIDTIPPVLKLNGSESITLNKGDSYIELGASAIDNIDGDISSKIIISGNVDTNTPGTYIITYTIIDSSGNESIQKRSIIILDNIPPIIILNNAICSDKNITLEVGIDYIEAGAEASDNLDGNLTNNIIITGDYDKNNIGEYILKYSVTDSSNNTSIAYRKIKYILSIIPKTKQTISYNQISNIPLNRCDLKDDGFYQRGRLNSYTRNNNDTVSDNITGLIWQDNSDSNISQGDWFSSTSYCSNLNLAGLNWRLPSPLELLYLSDKSIYNQSDRVEFKYVTVWASGHESVYFTDKEDSLNSTLVWGVKFEDGRDYIDRKVVSNQRFTRCISGINVSISNFTRDSNGIVFDNFTGLEWMDNIPAIKDSWENAINYCENLSLGGYSDWRLPNINEFYSIVNRNTDSPAVDSIFQNITSDDRYWTSSSIIEHTDSAWVIKMKRGSDSWAPKGNLSQEPQAGYSYNPHYITCVRNK